MTLSSSIIHRKQIDKLVWMHFTWKEKKLFYLNAQQQIIVHAYFGVLSY
jgi:hypothetical protein